MISSITGEVAFSNGLAFRPHLVLSGEHLKDASKHLQLPIPGWTHHRLGTHPSEHGDFDVEAVSDFDCRLMVVLVSHVHPFYQTGTPGDSERRAFHEGVIATDLHGQCEYSWGEAFCHYDAAGKKDWLVIEYAQGPLVPRPPRDHLLHLRTLEAPPKPPSERPEP
jgi:hypothetical protein